MNATRDVWVPAKDEADAIECVIWHNAGLETERSRVLFVEQEERPFCVRLTVIDEAAPDPMEEVRRHVEAQPAAELGPRMRAWLARLAELTGAKL